MAPAPDPFEPYLNRAASLFDLGDVVQAGQIWQAILKRDPSHSIARAGLYKVKVYFDARATQDGLVVPPQPEVPAKASAPAAHSELDELLERGCALYDGGRTDEAVAIWEQVLARDPGNALARGYLEGAKRKLEIKSVSTGSMPTLKAQEAAAAAAQEAPAAPVRIAAAEPPAPAAEQVQEDNERLLRDGCTLFDMGQIADALQKWERILASNPHHELALGYANDARKDLGLEPLNPGAKPPAPSRPAELVAAEPGPGTAEPDTDQVENWVRDGVQLYDMGMVEEAVEKWNQALERQPGHGNAAEYLRMAQRDLQQAAPTAPAAPKAAAPAAAKAATPPPVVMVQPTYHAPARAVVPEPPAREELPQHPVKPTALPTPVGPPKALTTRATPQRDGFKLPGPLQGLPIPAWLTIPRNLGLAAAALVVVGGGLLVLRDHQREAALKEAVSTAKADAMRPVSRQVQVANLAETPEALRKEAEAALNDDPLLAYYRAQEWVRVEPGSAAAAQLLERARNQMSAQPPTGNLTEFQKSVQAGDLESAETSIRGLLRQTPDSADLMDKARSVDLALAQYYATKERFSDAKDCLCRIRAMYPQEKTWQAKLKLLESIQSMPRNDRAGWIQLLG